MHIMFTQVFYILNRSLKFLQLCYCEHLSPPFQCVMTNFRVVAFRVVFGHHRVGVTSVSGIWFDILWADQSSCNYVKHRRTFQISFLQKYWNYSSKVKMGGSVMQSQIGVRRIRTLKGQSNLWMHLGWCHQCPALKQLQVHKAFTPCPHDSFPPKPTSWHLLIQIPTWQFARV